MVSRDLVTVGKPDPGCPTVGEAYFPHLRVVSYFPAKGGVGGKEKIEKFLDGVCRTEKPFFV